MLARYGVLGKNEMIVWAIWEGLSCAERPHCRATGDARSPYSGLGARMTVIAGIPVLGSRPWLCASWLALSSRWTRSLAMSSIGALSYAVERWKELDRNAFVGLIVLYLLPGASRTSQETLVPLPFLHLKGMPKSSRFGLRLPKRTASGWLYAKN